MNKNKYLIRFLLRIVKVIVASRYKVTVKGADILESAETKLFLPNHQAIVDPIILFTQIFQRTSAVPVVTENYFNIPILKSIFMQWGAISVSDLESGSRDTSVLDEVTTKALATFARGENVVIYPSGQLAGQGFEKIFNKQSAWHIALAAPNDTKIIGVKFTGLWGSHWSKAWNGKSPNFGIILLRSIGIIFANLLLFVPKREVIIEFGDITNECKSKAIISKNAFNLSLEHYYNSSGEESVSYIKHFFFLKSKQRELPTHIVGSAADMMELVTSKTLDDIPLATFKKVSNIAAQVLKIDSSKIELGSNLMLDLGCDSLNLVEIVSEMEQVFPKVNIPEITVIRTISDLCLATMGLLEPKIVLKKQYFTLPPQKKSIININSELDIVSQFIKKVSESPNEWFTYDEMLGSTTRRNFLLKALALSELIKRRTTNEYIGILLPALQSSTMLILSTYLAGKKPVMLNWTVGNKVLEHCIETANIDTIISAGKFIKKIEDQLPSSVTDKLLLMENEVSKINLTIKLKALLYSRLPKLFIKSIDQEKVAVILFTSGSEDLPKAVPLTHKNIVSNLSSVFKSVILTDDLVFVGFLPPFHSFGFTVLSILPLISGIRIGYSPDPTDGKTISRLIKHLGANVILGSPSFIKIVLSNGSKNDFTTLKYAISGAEAMPTSLIELFNSLTQDAILLEGYGITECSPILTINPLEKQKTNSVGKLIEGVNGKIISLDSGTELEPYKEGMIYVKGDNIFNGYLNHLSNPFQAIDGVNYYKTGDLGYFDDEGYLFITGRLKRFIKIGGEMISLPFIEKVLLEKYGNEDIQSLAVEGSDKIQPPRIVLFTTEDIDLDEVNQHLLRNGVSALARIKEKIIVKEIPFLGSGKVDYKELKKLIEI